MNIAQFDKRDVAYGSFLQISCRKCGDIPIFVAKYKDDGKDFDLGFPDEWYVEDETTGQITNVICPKCSRSLKLNKIKNVLKRK